MREDFERALQRATPSAAHCAVFADWLTDHGDPRGELISVQLALEERRMSRRERTRLEDRERQLLADHGKAWLGPLAPYLDGGIICLHFRRGYVDTLEIGEVTAGLGEEIAASPIAPTLRRLYIASLMFGDTSAFVTEAASVLQRLPVLQVGDIDGEFSSGVPADGFVQIARAMPAAVGLHVRGQAIDMHELFSLELPQLRSLLVFDMDDYPLEPLAHNATFGNLAVLRLRGDFAPMPYLGLAEMHAITSAPHLKALRHLELRYSDFGDDGVEALVCSPCFEQLEVLDLAFGEMSDDGARMLAAHPHTARLDSLVVSSNGLTADGIGRLTALGIEVAATPQLDLHERQPGYPLWYVE